MIRGLNQYVVIRFAHEMDLGPDGLLTWAGQPPEVFIGAHRRIVDIFRQEGANKVRWLWSPGGYFEKDANGDNGRFISGDWYPGDAYVDFTGFSAFEFWGWEEWDSFRAANHIYRTPEEQIGPRYKALEVYGKPMIVPEVGLDLHPSKKADEVPWLIQLIRDLKTEYPKIRGLVYYNAPHNEPDVAADWRLNPKELQAIVSAVQSDRYFDTEFAR